VIVEISDPSRAEDLIAFLRSAACDARLDDTRRITVSLPEAPNEQAARRELELYLAVWEARQTGVRARRKPAYGL
jgi:hypothetical protein